MSLNLIPRLAAIQNLQASHDMIGALEDSKASIERLVDEMPHAIFVFDIEGRIYKANWEACRLMGSDPEAYIDRRLFEIFDREQIPILEQKIANANANPLDFETAHEFELAATTRSGQTLPYLWALRPLSPRDFQRLSLFVLYGRNLTDVRTFDLELSRIYSNISLGILTIDSEGLVEPHYSRYCEYLLQMPSVSGMNNGFARMPFENVLFRLESLAPEDGDAVRLVKRALGESEHWFEAMKSQFPQLLQRRIDGGNLWIKVDYYPIAKNGIVQKILLILENRTEIIAERQERSHWIRRNEVSVRRILEVQNADSMNMDTVSADLKELISALDNALEKGENEIFRKQLGNLKVAASHGELRSLEEMIEIFTIGLDRSVLDRESLMRGYAPIRAETMELLRIHATLNLEPHATSRMDAALSHSFATALDQALASIKNGQLPKAKKILTDLKKNLKFVNYISLKSLEPYLVELAHLRAAQDGKAVRLDFDWDGLSLPMAQLRRLRDLLSRLLEQSLSNGIEKTGRRRRNGKPVTGQIHLEAKKKGDRGGERLHFRLSDDGRGVSAGLLREIFVMRRVAPKEKLQAMTDEAVLQLIFQPEFLKNSFSSNGIFANLGKVSLLLQRLGALDGKLSSTLGRGVSLEFSIELDAKG